MVLLGELLMILDLHRQGLSITAIARRYAAALGQRTTGVAILERTINAETGEEDDRLVASGGAVPPFTPGVMQ